MSYTETEISKKVLQYETFVNEVLREDLKKICAERDKLCERIAEYVQLKNTIQVIQDAELAKEGVKTKVDLGCNFYVQANVTDPSKIFVHVGFGFYLELTLDEALKFIDKKTSQLNKQVDSLKNDSAKIKTNIKLVLLSLRELQNIQETEEKPRTFDL